MEICHRFRRLDGILNLHKMCSEQMATMSSMGSWTHIIRTLQNQRLELLKVQHSILAQWQSYHVEANRFNNRLNQMVAQNAPKQSEYAALKSKVDGIKKQITEIYDKISRLSVKRKVLEKQMQSATQQMTKCRGHIEQMSGARDHFKRFIDDRKAKAVKLVEFMKTIDVISKQYCRSVETMQDKVARFEPLYLSWNSGEVVTWFENVDRGILNKSEPFLKFKTQLIANGVTGKDLQNFNDFSLKMMGLHNDRDRQIIIRHLNKLLVHSQHSIAVKQDTKSSADGSSAGDEGKEDAVPLLNRKIADGAADGDGDINKEKETKEMSTDREGAEGRDDNDCKMEEDEEEEKTE